MVQRKTRQRAAIRQVIEEAGRPLRAEAVLEAARKLIPGLGQATVYRALNSMQQEHMVVPVEIPGHSLHYEKSGLKHHHHFVCTGCRRIFELPGCSYAGDKGIPPGFSVDGHEVILYGHCTDCRV